MLIMALTVSLSPTEQSVFDNINLARQRLGLPMVELDESLIELARNRSRDMATRGYFAHVTPEGTTAFNMLDELGIYSPYAGECLARTNESPEVVFEAFMESPSHRKVLLNPHYSKIGVGQGIDSNGMLYIAVILIGY